jgi:ribose transport system permease protein
MPLEELHRMADEPRTSQVRRLLADYLGLVTALVVLLIIFGVCTKNFFSVTTFRAIANQIPDAIIATVGMTFVLLIAGIDLSVGSVMALGGVVLGTALAIWRLPLGLAIAACLLVGLACGAVNGLVIIRWRLPSFIVTLGMLEVARGATYLITQSRTISIDSSVEVVTKKVFMGLSIPFFAAVAVVAAGQLVLSRTVFGRYLVAIGTNEEAVRLSGIDPRPYKLAVFVLSCGLAAAAAVIRTAQMSAADPNTGISFELEVIAAAVIGGTSLMGGRGSVVGSFLGVLILAVLRNGLLYVGVQDDYKRLITGCVIVAAVILDQYRHRGRKTPKHN